RTLDADDLAAEQPPGRGLAHELDPDRPGARVVARTRLVLHLGGDDLDPGVRGLALGEPRACDLVAAQARHGGADHAREGDVVTRRVGARDAPLLVGVRAELDVHGLLEQPVPRLGAVAGREHAVVVGAAL